MLLKKSRVGTIFAIPNAEFSRFQGIGFPANKQPPPNRHKAPLKPPPPNLYRQVSGMAGSTICRRRPGDL